MNIDLINAELQTVALTQRLMEIDLTYQEFLDKMIAYHEMMMNESYSYDEDCIFYYGVN